MRSSKLLALLLGLLLTAGLASCLGDDDDAPSRQEVEAAMRDMAGDYRGRVVFPTDSTRGDMFVSDSTDITWTVSPDAVLTIHGLPARAVAGLVKDSTLRAQLVAQGPVELRCYIGVYTVKPDYAFLANPANVTYNNITYQGVGGSMTFAFAQNSAYSGGRYAHGRMTLQLVVQQLRNDATQGLVPFLTSAYPFVLRGSK